LIAPVPYNRFGVHGLRVLAVNGDTAANQADFRYDGVSVTTGCPRRRQMAFANP